MKDGQVIARDKNIVYFIHIYNDGRAAVWYDNGYNHTLFCGIENLRSHLHHLKNVRYGKNWNSLIPDEWTICDKQFFDKLGIY